MEYKFKFSIIMSVYNVEKYIEEAVDSIINQDIGFEENVQLIFVNDGSPDNSKDICLKYKELYPNNIVYVEKENGGLASAKNVGLNYIEGEYVNFFDADDILPINVLSEVYSFMQKNKTCVDFATIPLYFFEAQRGIHPKYKYLGNKNRIVDLLQEPYNFILSGAASFYKNKVFDDFRFDETYVGEEDTKLNGLLYLKNPRFGYICKKGVRYKYRKRFEQVSISDTAKVKPESYKTVIKLLNEIIPKNGILEKYQQELIIYELRSRLKQIDIELFESEKEYNDIIKEFSKYIKRLDVDYLVYVSKFCDSIALKDLFIKTGNLDYKKLETYMPTHTDITLQKNEIRDGKLYVDLTFYKYGMSNLEVVALSGDDMVKPYESNDFNSAFDFEIGNFEGDCTHLRRFAFELDKHKSINFVFINTKTNYCYPARKIKIGIRDIFNSYNPYIYYKNYRVYFAGRKIKINKLRNAKLSFLKRNVRTILAIVKNKKIVPLTRLFSKFDKKYILINDRFDKAGDNGEALFKYINKYEPELAKRTYYAISAKCDDYKRMKKYGKVVKHGSVKHRILFLNASHIYSSHTMPEFYNAYKPCNLRLFRDLFDYKFVWLQHGITQNDISKAANRYIKKIDYVTTCTNAEFAEFSQDKYCFDDGQVILTGFSRFDYLENTPKNIITMAPTWRRGYGNSDGRKEDFVETKYYEKYSKILTDQKLIKALEKDNLVLEFVLHPEMLNYVEDFVKYENKVIKIVRPEDINYSKIFSDSKLFITDYSSTFFDFAYLKKPEIFFQFDKDEFYQIQYKKGYFNHETDAFGDVLYTSKKVVDKIIYYINNDFKVENKYLKRIDDTFKYVDKNNSKRIIEETYKNK